MVRSMYSTKSMSVGVAPIRGMRAAFPAAHSIQCWRQTLPSHFQHDQIRLVFPIRCEALRGVSGGFDSHALPPTYDGALFKTFSIDRLRAYCVHTCRLTFVRCSARVGSDTPLNRRSSRAILVLSISESIMIGVL
jgi:hypothetical protein